ncbi:MAG: flagellar biosynthetic protein FliO [Pseudomonadota bacterium]
MDVLAPIIKMIAKLSIVLGLLVLTIYLMKRVSLFRGSGSSNKLIKLVASLPVGSKSHLLLVEVLNERLLIGVSQDSISLLTKTIATSGDVKNEGAMSNGS